MLVFGICFFMFITGFTATKVQNDRANRFSHYKLAAMFTILVIIDIMHCSIGQSQGWLKEIGGLHPYVSKESKCYEEEYLAYVYGMLIFGFFTNNPIKYSLSSIFVIPMNKALCRSSLYF